MANMLYNGIRLPALPDSALAYKVIVYCSSTSEYWFVPTATAYTAHDNGLMDGVMGDEGYLYDANTDSWVSGKISTLLTSFVKWANYDVYTTGGTLYLAASDPIPVGKPITDPLSFAMGYQLGCRLRAQRAVREPIGYSYNGVVLPELPEVEGNRFVVLVDVLMVGIVIKTALFYMDTAAYFASNWLKVTGSFLTYTRYDYNKETDSWDLIRKDHSMTSDFSLNSKLVWGNYDVTDGNGNVVMEKTDPVPVYE